MTETRFCPQCGKSVSAADRFCGACGASLTPGAMPAPQPTKPEAPAGRGRRVVAASLVGAALILAVATFATFGFSVATSQAESHLSGQGEAGSEPATDTPVPPANIPGDAAIAADPAAAVMEINVIAWHFSPPEPAFIDLPSLMSELDYDPMNDLTQLAFVCQPDTKEPVFYVLIAAPGFTEAETVDIAISFDDEVEPLRLRLEDLYASGVSAPAIDWDARILYAPADQMALAPLFEAPSLTVVSGDRAWRMGTTDMGEAANAFLGACWNES